MLSTTSDRIYLLDRVAQKVVLDTIKAQLRFNRARRLRDNGSYAETELERSGEFAPGAGRHILPASPLCM